MELDWYQEMSKEEVEFGRSMEGTSKTLDQKVLGQNRAGSSEDVPGLEQAWDKEEDTEVSLNLCDTGNTLSEAGSLSTAA